MRGSGGCFRNNSVPRSSQMRNLPSHPTQRRDHYQELTDKIVAALEAGIAPWRRPWDPNACGASTTPLFIIATARPEFRPPWSLVDGVSERTGGVPGMPAA